MRIAVLCNDRLGIPALQYLVQNRLIIAAGTSDRTPEMIATMHQVSEQAGVPSKIFSRKNLSGQLLAWLDDHKPDVVFVKTFPFRIPAQVLAKPKYGFINFHYAPLPEYRGSNPLFWMIKEGVTTGGIAVHQMTEEFDSGPILLEQAVPFAPEATFGICCTQLAYAGVQLTVQLIQQLQSGQLNSVPQEISQGQRWFGRPAPKDFFIDWNNMNAQEVNALVRACNPWLKGAPTKSKGWVVCITNAFVPDTTAPADVQPGTILNLSEEEGLVIVCNDQTLLKAEVVYCEEGVFPGNQLMRFGLKAGDLFN